MARAAGSTRLHATIAAEIRPAGPSLPRPSGDRRRRATVPPRCPPSPRSRSGLERGLRPSPSAGSRSALVFALWPSAAPRCPRSRGRRRHRHAQFRQRRHRGGGQGGGGDHRPQLRRSTRRSRARSTSSRRGRCPKSLVYPTLLSALRLQGFAAVEGNGITKLVLETDAKMQGGPVAPRPGRRRRRPAGHAGHHAAVRIGAAARQRAAAADHAEQHDRRVPRAPTRSSSPTTPRTCGASRRSSRRSTSRRPASR